MVQVSFEKVLIQPEIFGETIYFYVCGCVTSPWNSPRNILSCCSSKKSSSTYFYLVVDVGVVEPILGKPDSKGIITSRCV